MTLAVESFISKVVCQFQQQPTKYDWVYSLIVWFSVNLVMELVLWHAMMD